MTVVRVHPRSDVENGPDRPGALKRSPLEDRKQQTAGGRGSKDYEREMQWWLIKLLACLHGDHLPSRRQFPFNTQFSNFARNLSSTGEQREAPDDPDHIHFRPQVDGISSDIGVRQAKMDTKTFRTADSCEKRTFPVHLPHYKLALKLITAAFGSTSAIKAHE